MRTTLKSLMLFQLFLLPFIQGFAGIINVKKMGAKGDGKTDDTKAVQAAIDAAPAEGLNTIYFPKGVYLFRSFTITANYLENYFIKMHSNLIFKGDGNGSILKLADHLFDKTEISATAQLFYGANISNIIFTSLQIDMNGAKNLCPASIVKNQRGIFINHGNNVIIKNISVKNNAGRNMIMMAGKGQQLLIQNNVFLNGGHYVGSTEENKNQLDFSFVYCEWDSTTVINNRIEQQDINIALNGISGGIELHGSYSYAADNKIIGCSPGIYVSSSWQKTKKTTVEKNKFLQCAKGISFWVNYDMDSITINNNFMQLTYYRNWKGYTSNGIEIPNGNTDIYDSKHANGALIYNLLITGNTIIAPTLKNNKDRTTGMVLHSLQNGLITNNIIKGMNFGGVLLLGSKWGTASVKIKSNKFIDFTSNYDAPSTVGYVVVFDSYTKTIKDGPGVKNIQVSGNYFERTAKTVLIKDESSRKKGRFTGAFVALPEYMQKEIHFEDNRFSDKDEKVEIQNL